VRAIGVHEDVIVVTSRLWQTNCTLVRGPGVEDEVVAGGAAAPASETAGDAPREAFVIDSPIFPDELELLPALLEQAGFAFAGLLVTHGDWDHLLGRLAFAGAAVGCAETTAARLAAEPGVVQRELRDFDQRHYVARPAPLSLGHAQALPVPGYCGVGGGELELHPTEGHTVDGMAIVVPWAGVLVCGDYLSPVEIPTISEESGSLTAYEATLARLEPLVRAADTVVPGHGEVLSRERALEILEQDAAYVAALRDDPEAARLPPGRDDAEQRRLHAANVAAFGGAAG
jgi:glyoxylase-like metal-dependent hydrolase (beta-lactamase superfamily II)